MIKIFENLEEIKSYYDEKSNTYIFKENGKYIDIVMFRFYLDVDADIDAKNINACWGGIKANDIKANDIDALHISADDINAKKIEALDINADDIDAKKIDAKNISADEVNAVNIKACNIRVNEIYARNIRVKNIKADVIRFDVVCYASESIKCQLIHKLTPDAKYFASKERIEFIK